MDDDLREELLNKVKELEEIVDVVNEYARDFIREAEGFSNNKEGITKEDVVRAFYAGYKFSKDFKHTGHTLFDKVLEHKIKEYINNPKELKYVEVKHYLMRDKNTGEYSIGIHNNVEYNPKSSYEFVSFLNKDWVKIYY
jgi:hypothetical protein